MVEFVDNIGRPISPPLKHSEVDGWLRDYEQKQKEDDLIKAKERKELILLLLGLIALFFAVFLYI